MNKRKIDDIKWAKLSLALLKNKKYIYCSISGSNNFGDSKMPEIKRNYYINKIIKGIDNGN